MRTNVSRVRNKRGAYALPPLEKLESMIANTQLNQSGCMEWKGALRGHMKYSSTKYRNKSWFGHRLVYTLIYGEPREGLCVLHSCDNPKCINPEHLFLGTNQDNVDDKMSKGRDQNVRKTHCLRGHPFSGYNLVKHGNKRRCRKCMSIRAVKATRKKRALLKLQRDSE